MSTSKTNDFYVGDLWELNYFLAIYVMLCYNIYMPFFRNERGQGKLWIIIRRRALLIHSAVQEKR